MINEEEKSHQQEKEPEQVWMDLKFVLNLPEQNKRIRSSSRIITNLQLDMLEEDDSFNKEDTF